MTAPERIWWNPEGHWSSFDDSEIRYDPSVEYTRTDLCITRAEHEAAVAAACMAMRDRCADMVEREGHGLHVAIRHAPLPTPADARASLDRMLAEARAEGMREAAGIAESMAESCARNASAYSPPSLAPVQKLADLHDGGAQASWVIAGEIRAAAAALSPPGPDAGGKGE
jgi:hypothetical protein